jgi:hypothetical protein
MPQSEVRVKFVRRFQPSHLTLFPQGKTAIDRVRSHNLEVNGYENKI